MKKFIFLCFTYIFTYQIVVAQSVTTDSVDNITNSSATLHGTYITSGTFIAGQFFYGTVRNNLNLTQSASSQYASTTTPVTGSLTSLTSNTTYYYSFKADNFPPSTYTTYSGDTLSFITLAAAPTIQASSIDLSNNIQSATIDVLWTKGNGSRRICLANTSNSFPTSANLNTNDYSTTANSDYTAAPTNIAKILYDGTDDGTTGFTASGLTPGQIYYFKVVEYNNTGVDTKYSDATGTGNPNSATTLSQPTLVTNTATGVSYTEATLGGNVSSIGGSAITERGVCYSINSQNGNPEIGGANVTKEVIDNTSSTGSFSKAVTGLTSGTQYAFKAYATNSAGTAYGDPALLFTTSTVSAPTVITSGYSNVTQNTATLSGEVTSNGGATLTARGLCYGTSANPDINGSHTTGGTTVAAFDHAVSGLTAGTTYYIRAYATNSSGTSYGSQLSFQTSAAVVPTLTTANAATITQTSAYLGGNVTADGGAAITDRGICISLASDNTNPQVGGIGVTTDPSGSAPGTGSFSDQIVNLKPASTYYFNTYATNDGGSTYGYGTAKSFTTNSITQASSITIGTITSTSVAISWAGGDGDHSLVVVHQGTGTFADPVDGVDYTPNGAFGSGDETVASSGNYVVYEGSGSSTTITGLSPSTTYEFKVYEFVGTGTNTYYQTSNGSGANPNSTSTSLASAPTTQASSVNFTSVGSTGFTINWTNGNGIARIVAVREGSQGTITNPTDNQTYAANSDWSIKGDQLGNSGYYIAYNGSSNSVSVSNLNPNTVYWVQVFEYNNTPGNERYNKNTETGNPASTTTFKAQPSQASNIQFSNISNNSMTVSWTTGGGDGAVLIARADYSIINFPADGTPYTGNSVFTSGENIGNSTYVLYSGTNTSVNVTNLLPGVMYDFMVCEFNNSGSNIDYNTSPGSNNPLSQRTLNTTPTTQCNSIVFSTIQSDQITVSVSGGNGDNRIILAKQGSPVNALPVNGIEYTGTSTFGTGQSIGSGNYVIAAGGGSGVTVSNLLSNTRYYFKVFEYNNTGTNTLYKTDGFSGTNPDDTITTKTAPTTQASNLGFSNITSSGIDLSWTRGNGDSVLVLAIAGSTLSEVPVDGTAYNPNPVYSSGDPIGSAYVVYTGVGTSASVTGLTPSTQYAFKAFEFSNGEPFTTYLSTSGTNVASQYTVGSEPTVQSYGISFTDVQSAQVTFTFTAGTGGGNRLILAHQGAAVDANPVDGFAYTANGAFGNGDQIGTGNYVIYNSNGTSATVTNLLAQTDYYFKVYEYSGTGTDANYLTTDGSINNPSHTTTAIGKPVTQASSLSFSAVTDNSMTVNWTNGSGDSVIVVGKVGSSMTETPTDGVTYQANNVFAAGNTISIGCYVVYKGIGTTVNVSSLAAGTNYTFKAFSYNTVTGYEYYQTADASYNPRSRYTISAEPTTQGTFTGISSSGNTLNIQWTNGNGNGRLIVAREGTPITDVPLDATNYAANAVFAAGDQIATGTYAVYAGTGTNSLDITGLKTSTNYYFTMFEYNSSGGPINYLTISAPTTTGTTGNLSTPTLQASNINFTNYGTSSITINWTNGDGESRLVAVKEGTQGTIVDPSNPTVYTASTDWNTKGDQLGSSGYYVVSVGSGSSVSLTNLVANTSYWVQIYEYNNPLAQASYLTTTSGTNPLSFSTLKTAPATQVSGISLTNETSNGFSISYSTGNGDNRLVVVRETATSNVAPSDFTNYTANTVFGTGDFTGAGNYVIYNGTGTSTTVTGLTTGTSYTAVVYEYNNSGANAVYNTTVGAGNSAATTTLGTASWTGSGSSGVWTDAGNWNTGVPSSSQSVIIPSGKSPFPDITGTVTVDNMNVASGAYVNVSNGGSLTITNSMLLESSGSNSPSGMLVIPGTGSFSAGSSTMELYCPNTYNLVSFPITSPAMTVFYGNFAVNHYDEANATYTILSPTASLSVGHGYSAKLLRTNRVLSFTGNFNSNAGNVSVTNAFPGDSYYGWNLVGNPYPSAIDWNAAGWTKTNIDNTVYCYKGSNGTWTTYNGSAGTNGGTQYIAPGQGFFIHAQGSGSFGMTNAVRVSNQPSFFKKATSANPLIRLMAEHSEITNDIVILFTDEATEGFDTKFDAYRFLPSGNDDAPDIYSILSDKSQLVINALNSDILNDISNENYKIPIGISQINDGIITISASELINIPESIRIYLYDSQENTYTNLKNSTYEFDYTTQSDNRFSLVLSASVLDIKQLVYSTPKILIYAKEKTLFIKSESFLNNHGSINVFDITGKLISSVASINSTLQKISMEEPGTYIIKVIVKDSVVTQKIVVQ